MKGFGTMYLSGLLAQSEEGGAGLLCNNMF